MKSLVALEEDKEFFRLSELEDKRQRSQTKPMVHKNVQKRLQECETALTCEHFIW